MSGRPYHDDLAYYQRSITNPIAIVNRKPIPESQRGLTKIMIICKGPRYVRGHSGYGQGDSEYTIKDPDWSTCEGIVSTTYIPKDTDYKASSVGVCRTCKSSYSWVMGYVYLTGKVAFRSMLMSPGYKTMEYFDKFKDEPSDD